MNIREWLREDALARRESAGLPVLTCPNCGERGARHWEPDRLNEHGFYTCQNSPIRDGAVAIAAGPISADLLGGRGTVGASFIAVDDEGAVGHRDDAVALPGDGVVRNKTHGFSLPPKPSAYSGENCDHVCPECKTGKHRNCDGTSWCFRDDVPAECSCLTCEWGRS